LAAVAGADVLILLPDQAPPASPPPALIQVGDLEIRKGYRLILLWELDGREWLASGHPYVWPLIPLMRGGEAELRASIQAVGSLPEEEERRELAAYLSILGGLRYDRGLIHELLAEETKMIPLQELESSSVYQDIVEKAESGSLTPCCGVPLHASIRRSNWAQKSSASLRSTRWKSYA
jgi:predicted transposase YdaD